MAGLPEHEWCVVKHLLLAARYVEEAYEYALRSRMHGFAARLEPIYLTLHSVAIEAVRTMAGERIDHYMAYHLAHALMELLEAEVHAAEAGSDLVRGIHELRGRLLALIRELAGGGKGERGAGEGSGEDRRPAGAAEGQEAGGAKG